MNIPGRKHRLPGKRIHELLGIPFTHFHEHEYSLDRGVQGFIHKRQLGLGEAPQYVTGSGSHGFSDAKPEPVKIRRPHELLDGAEPVMPGVAASLFQFHAAERKIQLVVDGQNLFGRCVVCLL